MAYINTFTAAVERYTSPQRDRLIRRLTDWANQRPRYAVRIGDARVSFDVLTDDALCDMALSIAADLRRERKRNRENYARNQQRELVAAE